MASLAFQAIGTAIGGAPGGLVGGFLGAMLFAGKGKDTSETLTGPRLEDRAVQVSAYGSTIPEVYGTMRLAGNIIWIRDNQIDEQEITETTTQETPKGLFDTPTHTTTSVTYTYSARFAVLLCLGEVSAVTRIWWNGAVVYDRRVGYQPTGALPIQLYLGTEDQDPDPTMEEALGVDEVPGMRGYCYVVFRDMDLTNGGNTIGNWEFEVVRDGTLSIPDAEYVQPNDYGGFPFSGDYGRVSKLERDDETGLFWGLSYFRMLIIDPVTNTVVAEMPRTVEGNDQDFRYKPAYQPPLTRLNAVTGEPEYLPARMYVSTQGVDPNWIEVWDVATRSIIANIAVSRWLTGLLFYNPFLQQVLVFQGAFSGGFGVVDCWTGVYFDLGVPHDDVVAGLVLEEIGICAVILEDGDYHLYNITDTAYPIRATGTWAGAVWPSLEGQLAWDPDRLRLWYAGDGPNTGLHYLDLTDLDNPTFVEVYDSTRRFQNPIVYAPDRDMIFVKTDSGDPGGTWKIHIINAGDGTEHDVLPAPIGPTSESDLATYPQADQWEYIPEVGSTFFIGTSPNAISREYVVRLSSDDGISLREIVEDISYNVGAHPDEIDASALTELVKGYIVPRQMTARAAIEGLVNYGFFGGVESDSQLTFPLRNGATIRTFTEDDLVISDSGSIDAEPSYFQIQRLEEVELPREVATTFVNPLLHYQSSTHRARRILTTTENAISVELAVSMLDAVAKKKTDIMLDTAWTERTQYAFKLSYEDADLNPLDVIQVNLNGDSYEMIIESVRLLSANVVDVRAKSRDATSYSSASTAANPDAVPDDIVLTQSSTRLFLVDVPLIIDAHNVQDAGLYAFAGPWRTGQNWNGANVYRSPDGNDWSLFGSLVRSTPMGAVKSTSSNAPTPDTEASVIDRASSIQVVMSDGALSSVTEAELLDGKNAALWGNEIIQYSTATLDANGVYTLSGLLRGRRGTENAMLHTNIGETFVALNNPMTRIVTDASQRGTEFKYNVVSLNSDFNSGIRSTFTNTQAGLKPYAPDQIEGEWDNPSADDITITWVERTRLGAQRWPSGTTISSAEATDEWEIDILDTAGAIVRAVTGLSSATYTYTAANQTTDFGAAVDSVHVQIYQKSAQVGRGFVGDSWLINPAANIFEEDFSGFSAGSPPSGWTIEWDNTLTSWNVITDATGIGGQILQMLKTSAAGYYNHAYAPPITIYHPAQNILCRFRQPGLDFAGTAERRGPRVYVRCSGTSTTETGFFWGMLQDATGWGLEYISNAEFAGGSYVNYTETFPTGQWLWVRVDVRQQTLRAKVWADDAGSVEPSDYQLSLTAVDVADYGFTGFGFSLADTDADFDYFRIAYGGETA